MKPIWFAIILALCASAADQVRVESGILEGTVSAKAPSVRVFKGVPFAEPPVSALRWQAPRPVEPWTGVRKADEFGNRCVQTNPFADQLWRDKEESEDCLYLAIWTPAKSARAKLPVYVWFYGGGFYSGSGDEPRYDGEMLAAKGIVVVNVNYRLGVIGFLAHPELTSESGHKASGNYGLMDQAFALQWVQKNIAAFGGDPKKVTIGGESAGSFAVSGLMASPLAKTLIRGAVGESGAFFSTTLALQSLAAAEERGAKFGTRIAELRARLAPELVKAVVKDRLQFGPILDGYVLPADPFQVYAEGKQSRVPLLAGWNADEVRMMVTMNPQKPTRASFADQLKKQFGDKAADALKVYAASTDEEAVIAAGDLASDGFISYSTWKWIDMHARTSKQRVYRYLFNQPMPPPDKRGAAHASELEYVFNALDSRKVAWRPEDQKVADLMTSYWANFIKKGDPNGPGLPKWPVYGVKAPHQVMTIQPDAKAGPEQHRDRYEFLDAVTVAQRASRTKAP